MIFILKQIIISVLTFFKIEILMNIFSGCVKINFDDKKIKTKWVEGVGFTSRLKMV